MTGSVARPRGGRTLVMGVVNVTPDSFSDGGRFLPTDAAVAHGLHLLAEGADLLDIGGESTRPGAHRPSLDEELDRVVPVVAALATAAPDAVISVDTMRAAVAEAAVAAGARIVNDVSGGLADAQMLPLVARLGVGYIAMHWRGHSADMQTNAVYAEVVPEVCRELAIRRDAALAAGIAPERLILDPGLGFAKLPEHNWALIAHLDQVIALGHPVLFAASRKGFLGKVGRPVGADPRPADHRDVATAATSVLAALAGAWAVRVHDVRGTRDALDVVQASWAATGGRPSTATPDGTPDGAPGVTADGTPEGLADGTTDTDRERLFFHPRFFLHGRD